MKREDFKEYMETVTYTITVTSGSDFQYELQNDMMNAMIKAFIMTFEDRHKKNKVEVKLTYNNWHTIHLWYV